MAVTENTTAPNLPRRSDVSRDQRRSRLTSLLQAVAIAASAVFLLYLAWPRLHASLLYLPIDTAINRYYDTRETPVAQLEGLQNRARESIEIYPHHRYYEGLSLLYFLEAADDNNSLHVRRQAFEDSITAAESSLDRGPAQPRTWLRIAQARSWLRYAPDDVIAALKMAIFTGRVEPSMFMTRLTLGLSYLSRMDSEGTSMMRDQVLLAWQFQQKEMLSALKNGTLKMYPIEQLLFGVHDDVLVEIRGRKDGIIR